MKISKNFLAIVIFSQSLLSAQNSIKSVTIGKQVWMAKNLNVSTFRNGDTIPEAKSNKAWSSAGKKRKPAWCYYDNKAANGKKYGKLYNWYAVNDKRGLAPKGWHIPDADEWIALTDTLGGQIAAGNKMMTDTDWISNPHATDSSGFTALPAGIRIYEGTFDNIPDKCGFWSATDEDVMDALYMEIKDLSFTFTPEADFKASGFSVRCLKNN